jgi:ectoine hydroxylase-related dioxygenase (phytanoyl-CoA dioxygenase family)
VTCWVALDDVSEANGTIYLLPYSRAGTRKMFSHKKNPVTDDLERAFRFDRGIPVVAIAGSIAVFSSNVFHRSGMNSTSSPRRIYLPQYSAKPFVSSNGRPLAFAKPFLVNGKRRDGR